MKILTFGASTSASSINRQFAKYAASQLQGAELTDLDSRTFELPVFNVDLETADGIPSSAKRFLELIQSHDALVVSLAEHNGTYTSAFKNLYDWTSRLDQRIWSGKPMLLLSTSPGARGGATVMEAAKATFPRMGAQVIGSFSLPSFYDHFSAERGITHEGLNVEFQEVLKAFSATISG